VRTNAEGYARQVLETGKPPDHVSRTGINDPSRKSAVGFENDLLVTMIVNPNRAVSAVSRSDDDGVIERHIKRSQ
jgi:hypothetical protein